METGRRGPLLQHVHIRAERTAREGSSCTLYGESAQAGSPLKGLRSSPCGMGNKQGYGLASITDK